VGYNSFLYSSENDARSILMWLVERLPKEASALTAEVLGECQFATFADQFVPFGQLCPVVASSPCRQWLACLGQ
jgi:hypothetical protein